MGNSTFVIDESLLDQARDALGERKRLLWLIGGSGSGKTTVSRAIADQTGVALYDMDEAFFGRYQIDPQRHPATTAWFSAANPLGWMLSLPWPEFDALYRATNAEMLDMLAADLAGQADKPLLIDGGITHLSVLARVVPPAQVVCLVRDAASREQEWETSASRAEMRAAVLALPDVEAMWSRFLEYDRRMTATIGRESQKLGIVTVAWDETTPVEKLVATVVANAGWRR